MKIRFENKLVIVKRHSTGQEPKIHTFRKSCRKACVEICKIMQSVTSGGHVPVNKKPNIPQNGSDFRHFMTKRNLKQSVS